MKITKDDKAMLREQYAKAWHEDARMVEYCVGKASGYIDIGGTLWVMDKPSIRTDFWFGEHTYDYDEVCERCDKASESERYFIGENLRNCPAYEMLEALEGRDRWGYDAHFKAYLADDAYWSQDEDCRLGHVNVLKWHVDPEEYYATREGMMPHRELTEDETEQVKDFLREEVEKFQKRLKTYLKRYGLSKCHYGVYWADR